VSSLHQRCSRRRLFAVFLLDSFTWMGGVPNRKLGLIFFWWFFLSLCNVNWIILTYFVHLKPRPPGTLNIWMDLEAFIGKEVFMCVCLIWFLSSPSDFWEYKFFASPFFPHLSLSCWKKQDCRGYGLFHLSTFSSFWWVEAPGLDNRLEHRYIVILFPGSDHG
jgi:hypothetical protein